MKYARRALYVLLPFLILLIGWTQRYNLQDWWRLRNYDPPSRIVMLADDTAMTDKGRKLFYVNHPELNSKEDFNQNCSSSEQSIVLGCYVSGQGIYLYDVADERLLGVHQVTAAHEMLHAAYERLGDSEKERISALLEQVLASITDERIKTTVDTYRQRDPAIVPNELHSILATEVEVLPAELEDYYQRYFSDRQAVVRFSKQYEGAFQERKDKVAEYDAQLTALKQGIDSRETNLDAMAAQLAADRQQLEALAAAKRYEEYNAQVPGFNQSVRAYNTAVNQIRVLIDRYNDLVAERNAVALEENELVKAIDSRPDTIPTQ